MSSLSLLCFWLYAVMYCGLFFLFFLMIRRPPRSTRTAHSFPTRRSSDLANFPEFHNVYIEPCSYEVYKKTNVFPEGTVFFKELQLRSEEHTSELQSLMRISYAVFCLKKKKKL